MDVTRLAEQQAQQLLRDSKPLSPKVAERIRREGSGLRAARYHN